jgi:hypothetical protein
MTPRIPSSLTVLSGLEHLIVVQDDLYALKIRLHNKLNDEHVGFEILTAVITKNTFS